MKWSVKELGDRVLALACLPFFCLVALCFPFRFRDNWLVGENVGRPHKDNGYCFFRYCINQDIRHVFFVASREAIENDEILCHSDRVLVYGSIRHLIELARSSTLMYTHTQRDIIYHRMLSLSTKGKKWIFLAHGVTAFKKFHPDYHNARNAMDIFTVVSEFEKSIIVQKVETDSHRVQITGFPRFDFLENHATAKEKQQILYFPTWRDWIIPGKEDESEFAKELEGLLTDTHLRSLLYSNGLTLNVCSHTRLKLKLETFSSTAPEIHLIPFGQESVQELLSRSHLLITDYSSVSWDFCYLGKPVLFYQFDIDDYLRNRGAYIDLREPPFGERAESRDELLSLLSDCVQRKFRLEEKDRLAVESLFKYHDRANCRRVYDAARRLHQRS